MIHAEGIQHLRDVLRDQGLTEIDEPEAEATGITCHGDGYATVAEFTEHGPLVYEAPCPCPRHRPEPEGPAA